MNASPLNEHEESILRYIESYPSTKERIREEFTDVLSWKQINHALTELEKRKYIKIEQHLAAGVYSYNQKIDDAIYDDDYVLTPIGKNYLVNATANFTSFSNITNSNIAHQSPNTQQSININEQPLDIQQKIKELELAILKKDSSGITKAFGYIADKSVDVAIAIVTGSILK